MKRILNRDEYLYSINDKKYLIEDKSINEAFANEINWGDSLLGRLINSLIRKAGVGIDLRKMDNVISRLKEQFDILKDQIKVKSDSESSVKMFYLFVSALMGKLIEEIEDDSNSEKDILVVVESIIYEIRFNIQAEDDLTKKEKETLIKKLEEFLDFIRNLSGKTSGSSIDFENEVEDSDDDSLVPGTEIKKIIPLTLSSGQNKPLFKISTDSNMDMLSIDLTKVSNDMLPGILIKIDNYIRVLHNSLIVETKIKTKDNKIKDKMSEDMLKEMNKLYREISLKIHPDKIAISGLTEEIAIIYMQRLNELNDAKDLERMKKFSEFINLIIKSVEIRKKIVDKLEEISNDNDKTETDEKNLKLVESNLIKRYERFVLEKLETKELREKFDSIFDVEFMKKYQVTKDPSELDREFVSKENSITIDPIIEIVKIFNRAYKLHTPGIIPSGRKNGKVSNKVFREYEYVGKGTETARMSSEGGVEPGTGPYRNKSIFNKWENSVLDILKNPEYQQIFNENTYFHFSPSDPRYNTQGSKKGGGKSLLKLINSLLDGSELYREGSQSKFIQEYFDVVVNAKDLGFTVTESSEVSKTSSLVKDIVKYKFVQFNKSKIKKPEDYKNLIFKTRSGENTWFLKIERLIDKKMIIIMTNGFPYDLNISGNVVGLSKDGNIWLTSSTSDEFEYKKIGKMRIKVPDSKAGIVDWEKNDKTFNFDSFDVLVGEKDGEYFNDTSSMKIDEHKNKERKIKDLKDSEINNLL